MSENWQSPALRELAARGFIEQMSDGPAIDAALAKPTTFYIGYDPTAASLHVGSPATGRSS
jgi:tyrosyl-tRNA synthetase